MKICHLPTGMYAGIGSAGTNHFYRMAGKFGKYHLKFPLNGHIRGLLHLPAFISCSVVLNDYFVIFHYISSIG